MATVATQLNSGSGFAAGEVVTATKLNNLVNTATVTGIVNADIDAAAAISLSKLNLGSGITSSQIADGAVTGAAGGGKLAASAITAQTQLTDALATADEFLVYDASASALRRVAWSSLQPSGSIIQTVASSQNLATTLTSTTIVDSGLAPVSLTRKQTNSKIQLTLTGGRQYASGGDYINSTYFYVSVNGGVYANVSSLGSTKVEHVQLTGGQQRGPHSASFI